MTTEASRSGAWWHGRVAVSAALAVDTVVVLGAMALMILGSGYGDDLVGTALGGRVVLLGVAGALIMPAPLVIFWALLSHLWTVQPSGVAPSASRGVRPRVLAMGR